MIYEGKSIKLKDGRSCLLRSPVESDAEAMLSYLKQTSRETDFMSRYEDEVTMSADDERSFIAETLTSSSRISVAAFINGDLAGNASVGIVSPVRDKYRHRSEFGISIKEEFWNLGLGSALLDAVIESAKAMGFEQIELEVAGKNGRARALYEKFGFKAFGTRENTFKFWDGSYDSAYLMVKKL